MRLLAPELYRMRVGFEQQGRPPHPPAYPRALAQTRAVVPNAWSIEDFLRARGFADRAL